MHRIVIIVSEFDSFRIPMMALSELMWKRITPVWGRPVHLQIPLEVLSISSITFTSDIQRFPFSAYKP